MDAIAFDPGFVGGKAAPSRTFPGMPAGSARPFEDFLPRDDSPPRPADKPRRSDRERPPATAERPGAGPPTDRPDDRSDDRDDARSADAADAATPAAATPPPAKEPATPSSTAAGSSEEMTTAKPTLPPAGATPSGQAATGQPATAPTATTPNAGQATDPGMPGDTSADMQTAAALKATPGTTPGTTPGAGDAAAQSQNGPAPIAGADATSQTLPADAAGPDADATAPASAKAGPATGAETRVAAQQISDATRLSSDGSGTGRDAGARNGLSAQPAQTDAQRPATPAGPAIAQTMDSSGESGGAPDAFASIGDGDLSSASTGQSLAGTPSNPTQATHGAAAAGGQRPVPTPPMLAEQIAVHIQRGMERGSDRIDIRLTPAELGRIEVRLELGHDGRVHAAIAVDRAETLDLLQRDARSLERALQDAGLKTDSGGLTFNLRGDGRQQSNTGFAANEAFTGSGPERSEPDVAAPDVVANVGERRIHLDGVVDIRV